MPQLLSAAARQRRRDKAVMVVVVMAVLSSKPERSRAKYMQGSNCRGKMLACDDYRLITYTGTIRKDVNNALQSCHDTWVGTFCNVRMFRG